MRVKERKTKIKYVKGSKQNIAVIVIYIQYLFYTALLSRAFHLFIDYEIDVDICNET